MSGDCPRIAWLIKQIDRRYLQMIEFANYSTNAQCLRHAFGKEYLMIAGVS